MVVDLTYCCLQTAFPHFALRKGRTDTRRFASHVHFHSTIITVRIQAHERSVIMMVRTPFVVIETSGDTHAQVQEEERTTPPRGLGRSLHANIHMLVVVVHVQYSHVRSQRSLHAQHPHGLLVVSTKPLRLCSSRSPKTGGRPLPATAAAPRERNSVRQTAQSTESQLAQCTGNQRLPQTLQQQGTCQLRLPKAKRHCKRTRTHTKLRVVVDACAQALNDGLRAKLTCPNAFSCRLRGRNARGRRGRRSGVKRQGKWRSKRMRKDRGSGDRKGNLRPQRCLERMQRDLNLPISIST
jgi:hypothetical protein